MTEELAVKRLDSARERIVVVAPVVAVKRPSVKKKTYAIVAARLFNLELLRRRGAELSP
jgi:hypothetical protein